MTPTQWAIDTGFSSLRWLLGLSLGAIGASVAYVIGVSLLRARRLTGILVDFLRAIPIIALVPAFAAIFGAAETGKFLLIACATGFPIYIQLSRTRPEAQLAAKVLTAAGVSRSGRFLWIDLPGIVADLFSGVRVALGIGWISVVAAELLGVYETGPWSGGLGNRVTRLNEAHDYAGMAVCLATFGALGLLSAGLYGLARRALVGVFHVDFNRDD